MLGDTNGDFKRKLLGKTEEKVRGYRSVALSHYCGNGYAFCVMISRKLGLARFDELGAWKQGHQRAPHKPLLALCALSRWQRGQADVTFRQLEPDFTAILKCPTEAGSRGSASPFLSPCARRSDTPMYFQA